MGKSRKNRSNRLTPSIKTIAKTAKNVADASIPVIENSVGAVYGTMATGLDLGVKGAKSITNSMYNKRRKSRTISGGRRRRTHSHRRRHK